MNAADQKRADELLSEGRFLDAIRMLGPEVTEYLAHRRGLICVACAERKLLALEWMAAMLAEADRIRDSFPFDSGAHYLASCSRQKLHAWHLVVIAVDLPLASAVQLARLIHEEFNELLDLTSLRTEVPA